MKKISTLAFMAFFCCLGVMAQVELGDIKFSVADGKKLSPTTGKITVTFPNVTGVADPTTTSFVLEGNFGNDDLSFDGVEGTFATGVTFDLIEFELQPATDYTLSITSVKVDGVELAVAGGYTLHFKTRGAERKTSWTFVLDQESKEKIVADDANDPNVEGTYWKCISADERHFIHQSLNDSEIRLDADNTLPMSEDLTFTAGSDKMFVGDVSGKFKGMLVFNATNLKMTVPDCKVGDVITFNGVNATKGNASKQTCIQALNGAAIAPDGIVSSTGLQDSVWVNADANYKFEVQAEGDITFLFGNFRMRSIDISEAQEKKPCTYSIVAEYADSVSQITLKELVPATAGMTGTTVKTQFPFWLMDENGNAYQHSAISKEFNVSFELKGDTTFVLNYSKTPYQGVVFCSEAEDIVGSTLCTSPNAGVRSSMSKAAFFTEDQTIVWLEPGTYQIRAILFDATKEPNFVCTIIVGTATEQSETYLSAVSTNWTEAESDLLYITERTVIAIKAGGNENQGIDAIMIYATTEETEGVAELKANAKQAAARKVLKNGQLIIETAAGTVNVAGLQVK